MAGMENAIAQHPWLALTGALVGLSLLAWVANEVTRRSFIRIIKRIGVKGISPLPMNG